MTERQSAENLQENYEVQDIKVSDRYRSPSWLLADKMINIFKYFIKTCLNICFNCNEAWKHLTASIDLLFVCLPYVL